jgi:hypothetical protein
MTSIITILNNRVNPWQILGMLMKFLYCVVMLIQLCFPEITFSAQLLTPDQYFDTTGARELTPFTLNEEHYIAIAQLAKDIPDTPPAMNGGDADVDVVLLKRKNETFVEYQRIPGHGNEGATYFTMDGNSYLAIPSVNSGPKPPFNHHTYSMLYRWDGHFFYPVQQFYTFAAKQVYYFNIGTRHFIAIANGVVNPDKKPNPAQTQSMIYEWNGKKFIPFQSIPSSWGYSFKSFTLNNTVFLAFADHLNQSTLYRWDGTRFVTYQQFKGNGGRDFDYFTIDGKHYLAFANIITDSAIYVWDGKLFTPYQKLEGQGGRSFVYFTLDNEHYLFRMNHITGGRTNPKTDLESPLYQWKDGKFVVVQNIPTFGGSKAHIFNMDGFLYLTVANSLSKDVRFKVKSVLYQVTHGQNVEFG